MATAIRLGRPLYTGAQVLAPRVTEALTETGTSQATTITARQGEFAEITAITNAVYANVNSAASASAWQVAVPVGGTGYIPELAEGDAVTIITV